MVEDFVVCPMVLDDVDDVWEIERLCFPIPWSREAFCLEIEKNMCAKYFIAKRLDTVLGYGGMWLILDEGHITNIAVHPAYRNMGAGEAIIRTMMDAGAKMGMTQMTLEVRKTNFIAQHLYKKLGFVECGIRKAYYADNNEDAIIMWNRNIGGKVQDK